MVPLPAETHETNQHITTPTLVFSLSATFAKVTEEIFEVTFTNVTATTAQPIRIKPFTATLKRKGPTPNNHIPKLSRKSSLPPLTSLSLTPPTLQQPPQQTHLLSFTFLAIYSRAIAELLGIIPQIPREMTIHIIF